MKSNVIDCGKNLVIYICGICYTQLVFTEMSCLLVKADIL